MENVTRIAAGSNKIVLFHHVESLFVFAIVLPSGTTPVIRQAIPLRIKPPLRVGLRPTLSMKNIPAI